MFTPWLEPNWLLEELYPPVLVFDSLAGETAVFSMQIRRGVPYTLFGGDDLRGWNPRLSTRQWQRVWQTVPLVDSGWSAPEGQYFWRVGYHASP